MKKRKNLLPALILSIGLIIASVVYAFANRYEVTDSGYAIVDKWTGEIEKVHKK